MHNIAVKAELSVNELSQLIKALNPREPSAASISLAEQARHDERARAEREQAELRALMEERMGEEKRQRIAAEAAARMAEIERTDPVQNITQTIVHHHPPLQPHRPSLPPRTYTIKAQRSRQ